MSLCGESLEDEPSFHARQYDELDTELRPVTEQDPLRRYWRIGCGESAVVIPAARSSDWAADSNELPCVVLTTKFPALCQRHGSEQLAIRIVAAGRCAGVRSGDGPRPDWWRTLAR